MRKSEMKTFMKSVQKLISDLQTTNYYSEKEKTIAMSSIMDMIYLLGVSIDKKKYKWAPGLEILAKEYNLDLRGDKNETSN